MYGTMVPQGNFDPGMSSLYCQQLIELLTLDGTATNGIATKDQWMVLDMPLRIEFLEM